MPPSRVPSVRSIGLPVSGGAGARTRRRSRAPRSIPFAGQGRHLSEVDFQRAMTSMGRASVVGLYRAGSPPVVIPAPASATPLSMMSMPACLNTDDTSDIFLFIYAQDLANASKPATKTLNDALNTHEYNLATNVIWPCGRAWRIQVTPPLDDHTARCETCSTSGYLGPRKPPRDTPMRGGLATVFATRTPQARSPITKGSCGVHVAL
ncbi:hypothetical protein BC628DRAFT_1416559 [Trametes gibbosa]|nr:hypothetical protein BC628DRAFT_1416559 [Trametes gibbosa]